MAQPRRKKIGPYSHVVLLVLVVKVFLFIVIVLCCILHAVCGQFRQCIMSYYGSSEACWFRLLFVFVSASCLGIVRWLVSFHCIYCLGFFGIFHSILVLSL